jgi:hypothetical protein
MILPFVTDNVAPVLMVISLKFVIPDIVATVFVKITLLVLGLKVPPTLIHAPPPPFIVNCAPRIEFKTPPASITRLLISVDAGRDGSWIVVDASGIITSERFDGDERGVQFSCVNQSVLSEPFHIKEVNSEFAKVRSEPKLDGKFAMLIFALATQLSTTL